MRVGGAGWSRQGDQQTQMPSGSMAPQEEGDALDRVLSCACWGSGATEKDQEGYCLFVADLPSFPQACSGVPSVIFGSSGGGGASLRLTQVCRRWPGALSNSQAPVKPVLQLEQEMKDLGKYSGP